MRVVVLALALALVAGHQNLAPSFPPGQTHVYRYEAKIMGGLPEERLAKAGLKLTSRVKISAGQDNILLLKLENPEIFEYSDVWPRKSFSQSEIREDLLTHLRSPIKFKYEQGIVGEILAPESIPTQVLNIHRGILNVFQLNIKQTQNIYELQEEGVQGVCKTQYTITENEKAERILLTKSRDLNHCHEKVIRDTGLAYTKTCLKCQEISKNLRRIAGYTYKLKKVSGGTLVEEASGNEAIQFTPFNELHGAATMQTKQHLVLERVEKVSVDPARAEYRHRGSLKYEFSSELLRMPIRLMKMTNMKRQIASLLTHLVEDNRDRLQEDSPLKFLELIQLLRTVDKEELRTLLNTYPSGSHPLERQWLMDAIPYIGNKHALEIIMEKILKADDVHVPEALQILTGSLHMLEPSDEIMEKVWAYIQQAETYLPVVRKSMLLSFGSLIHRHCADKPQCHDRDIKHLHRLLDEALAKGPSNTQEIVLLVKSISNAAHPSSLKSIVKLLPFYGTEGADLPKRVHIEAILALRGIARLNHKEVQNHALHLYMDQTLDPELRMLAVMVVFDTRPSMAVVTNVVNIVKSDRSLHVANFAHSLIKSLARSIGSVHPTIVAECNVALRLLGQRRTSTRLSKAFHLDYYSHHSMLGAEASIYIINDAAKIIPKSVVAKTQAFFAGAAADVLEIGVRNEGFQEYIMKNNLSGNSDATTRMKNILKALSNWKSLPVDQMLGSVYVKVLGQEIAFAEIDKQTIEEAIQLSSEIDIRQHGIRALHNLVHNGISKRFIKAMLASEMRRIIPTGTGLPMELALYTAAVTSARVQVRVNSNLPRDFQVRDILSARTDIESEIKPSVAATTYAVMGLNTDIAQVAVVTKANVKINVPARISASLDLAESNLKISAHPVVLPENLAVAVNVETQAVAMNTARRTPLVPDNLIDFPSSTATNSREMLDNMQVQDRPVSQQKVSQFDRRFCIDTAGVTSCLRIASHNARFIRDSALYRLIGKHLVHLSLKQSQDEAVEKWEMELQLGPEGKKKLHKINNLNFEEVFEGTPVLSKIKKILTTSLKNSSSSSSSSSSSHNSQIGLSLKSSSSSDSNRLINAMGKLLGVDAKCQSGSSSCKTTRVARKDKFTVKHLASLFSQSSSSENDKILDIVARDKFEPKHLKRTPKLDSTSTSEGKTLEIIRTQKKSLADSHDTVFVLILRPVIAGNNARGYEIAGYTDSEHNRVQVIMAARAAEDKWRLVADAMILSKNKVAAKIAWGEKTLKYDTMITAETGLVQDKIAARVRLTWGRLPSSIVKNVKMVYKRLLLPCLSSLDLQKRSVDTKQLSFTVVAESEKKLNLIFKSPQIVYKRSVQLSYTLPLDELKDVMPFDNKLDNAHFLLAKASSTECTFDQESTSLTTFSKNTYTSPISKSCGQVLVQDCTEGHAFMVTLKRESEQSYRITLTYDTNNSIDMFVKDGKMGVEVNGENIEMERLPYSRGSAKILFNPGKLSLFAPGVGISYLYFSKKEVKIGVNGYLRGKLCGLCGMGNGDPKRDYRTPSGHVTDNPISFAHSWTLASQSCNDQTGCRLRHESVELEREIVVHGMKSRCQSVLPVLRCLEGCSATKTSMVNVGFHCTSTDDNSPMPAIYERNIDLTETVESHLDCNCPAECA